MKFEAFDLLWSDGFGNMGVRLRTVAVTDYSLQDIATVPEIVVGIDPAAALTGGDMVRAITVHKPAIRWIQTTGGAIKFDIGAENPGDSGKILEDFLITMAAAPDPAPDPDAESRDPLPTIRIVDADIEISNEADGTRVHVIDGDILVAPHADGVRSVFDLVLAGPAAPLALSAEGLYRTADQRMTVTAAIAGLRINEISPGANEPLLALLPDEPLSGTLAFQMDKYFTIDSASLDLDGPETTIETTASANAQTMHIATRMVLAPDSLGETWPLWMRTPLGPWLSMASRHDDPRHLTMNGKIDRLTGAVALQGALSHTAETINITGTIARPELLITGSKGRTAEATAGSPAVDVAAENRLSDQAGTAGGQRPIAPSGRRSPRVN